MSENMEGQNFIKFNPNNEIEYAYVSRYAKEPSGLISWYIPAFNLYFSSTDMNDGIKRSQAMTQCFLNYWLNEEGMEAFIDKINRLGFRTANGKPIKAPKGKSKTVIAYPAAREMPGYDKQHSFKAAKAVRA